MSFAMELFYFLLLFYVKFMETHIQGDTNPDIIINLEKSTHVDISAKLLELSHPELFLKRHLFDNYYLYGVRENVYEKRSMVINSLRINNNIKSFAKDELLSMQKRKSQSEDILDDLKKRINRLLLRGKNLDPDVKLCKRSTYYPNFNDVKFPLMWNIHNEGQNFGLCGNDLNILPVWAAGYTGHGITVGVIDDGLQHAHPDLQNNYNSELSWDFNDEDDNPTPDTSIPGNEHGTKCAGIIAATANNSICIAGIAYDASIVGLKLINGPVAASLIARSLLHKNDIIDIYTASWGPTDDGKTMSKIPELMKSALRKGAMEGRRGLGSIFVWAAGNGAARNDTCSADQYVGSIHTIPIGSITEGGTRSYYSEVCPSLFAVVYIGASDENGKYRAASDVITDDIDGGCTTKFGGTSSAAPTAAGIFALALQANPRLTYRDMQHLVIVTSKVSTTEENGWFKNGAGFILNPKFGAGVLDAKALVMAAQEWITVPRQYVGHVNKVINQSIASPKTSANVYFDGYNSDGNIKIIQIEHVEMEIKVKAENRGKIGIDLFSPKNTHSRMLEFRSKDQEKNIDFTFTSILNWGENPIGNWTINVCNHDTSSIATFESVKLNFYGTSEVIYAIGNNVRKDLNSEDLRHVMEKKSESTKQLLFKKYITN